MKYASEVIDQMVAYPGRCFALATLFVMSLAGDNLRSKKRVWSEACNGPWPRLKTPAV